VFVVSVSVLRNRTVRAEDHDVTHAAGDLEVGDIHVTVWRSTVIPWGVDVRPQRSEPVQRRSARYTAVAGRSAAPAQAWDRSDVDRFATLPAGTSHPGGDHGRPPHGDVYVADFRGHRQRGSRRGLRPERSVPENADADDEHGPATEQLPARPGFHPATGAFLVIDFGNARVLNVDKFTGAATVFMTVIAPARD